MCSRVALGETHKPSCRSSRWQFSPRLHWVLHRLATPDQLPQFQRNPRPFRCRRLAPEQAPACPVPTDPDVPRELLVCEA